MSEDTTPFLISLVTLLLGAAFGFVVHRTSASLRYNGEWNTMEPWKKRSLGMAGVVAALAAGLYILSQAETFQPEQLLARMWLWQIVSAWVGGVALDFLWMIIRKGSGR